MKSLKLEEEKLFKSAKYEINNVASNLNHIIEKVQRHEYITKYDLDNWFIALDRAYGALFRVTKR